MPLEGRIQFWGAEPRAHRPAQLLTMAQFPKLIAFLETQLGCSGEEAAPIAIKLAEAGFRPGMLSAGSITREDLITLADVKPFEAAAMMAGAPAVEEIPRGGEADKFYGTMSAMVKPMQYLLGWSGREIHPSEPDNRSVESGIRYARSVVDRVTATLENVLQDVNNAVDAIKNDDVRVECRQSTPEVEYLEHEPEPPAPDPVVYDPESDQSRKRRRSESTEVAEAYRPTLPSYKPSPY